jgi:hypothetical protein
MLVLAEDIAKTVRSSDQMVKHLSESLKSTRTIS